MVQEYPSRINEDLDELSSKRNGLSLCISKGILDCVLDADDS